MPVYTRRWLYIHLYMSCIISAIVDDRPETKYLRHVRVQLSAECEDNPEAWKDLGLELLPPGDSSMAALRTIAANSHGNVIKCCSSMLALWLQRQPEVSWRQLIEALKAIGMDYVATDLEGKLIAQVSKLPAATNQLPKRTTQPLLMPSLDTIKHNPSLIGDGKWPHEQAKPVGNETVEMPAAEDITDANGLPCYRMKSSPQGIAVIINNKTFTCRDLSNRNGTDIDAVALERLFTYLGFYTNCYNDLTGREIKSILKEVAGIDYRHYDCLLVAILTHGIEGKLYGTDGAEISVQDITTLFNGDRCSSLNGKPKIFFLQACRGKNHDKGVKHDEVDGADEKKMNDHPKTSEEHIDSVRTILQDKVDETDSGYKGTLPAEADYLLAYSTIPGYVSWRNNQNGSWFVSALVNVFMEMADEVHLMDMLTEVNRRVADEFESTSGKEKQVPEPVSRLRKRLYFHPGKYSYV